MYLDRTRGTIICATTTTTKPLVVDFMPTKQEKEAQKGTEK
jgi:hypothetical protein